MWKWCSLAHPSATQCWNLPWTNEASSAKEKFKWTQFFTDRFTDGSTLANEIKDAAEIIIEILSFIKRIQFDWLNTQNGDSVWRERCLDTFTGFQLSPENNLHISKEIEISTSAETICHRKMSWLSRSNETIKWSTWKISCLRNWSQRVLVKKQHKGLRNNWDLDFAKRIFYEIWWN